MAAWRVLWALLLPILLAACATTTPPPSTRVDRSEAWLAHLATIRDISGFVVDGRLSEGSMGSATLFWRQSGAGFSARASGPFGSGAIALAGTPTAVTIRDGEQRITTSQPEAWLQQQLGWQLPVAGLRFWAVGRPMPGRAAVFAYNDAGQLAVLEQAGWRIHYEAYEQTQEGLWLPSRIRFISEEQAALLRIARWRNIERDAD
ncbi:MAG: lipoprotein insertase outer membrane protein LolB [Algiphilus sp.]|uniref:lipoprotein insertase outer membrane protein LolB n=1 Tax=Algiphilus sp. TaxID=1872431 RepID=UPI0032EF4A98